MRGLSFSAETASAAGVVSDFLELTKPGVVWLIVVSTAVGFYLGSPGPLSFALLFHALTATALLAGGAGALNQWLERGLDARMRRTENRPLPAGRLQPRPAMLFGMGLTAAGLIYLTLAVNPLSALLGSLTTAGYLLVYTPLKTRTPLVAFFGSVPGAMPPLIGWAAARNELSVEGWALFGLLFVWQFPHFYAIAWMYREDYARAGIRMLPVVKPDGAASGGAAAVGAAVGRRIVFHAALLVPVSLAPAWLGMTETIYPAGALACGLGCFYFALLAAREKTTRQARMLLRATVAYLPLIYCLLIFDKAS